MKEKIKLEKPDFVAFDGENAPNYLPESVESMVIL